MTTKNIIQMEEIEVDSETGSGALVFATSPTLVTPTIGAASATSLNKVAITAPATGSTLTIAEGKTLTASNTLTFTGTDSSSAAFGAGGTVAYAGDKLSDFAATTSAELAGVISDETGSGALVFAESPTLVTPALGTPASGVITSCTGLPVAGLADGTDGEIITWDSAGKAATVATGTSGQVLTSNGAGAPPTMQDSAASYTAIAVADLSDTATPSVLTTAETTGKLISNYKASGADHVFTMPAAHAAGNVIFIIGDEFQVDIEPTTDDFFYLNGTAMAANEHIQNTADTLGDIITGFCANINGTLRWMFKSDSANWVEETP